MSIDINNPYVGLRPFHGEESLLFFGRDEQTLELLQRLHEHHFVAVVGSSGCGKSSLLRAGLIPSLKGGYLVDDSDQWLISIMKPGQSPLYNLAESILKEINPKVNSEQILELVQKIKEEGVDAILYILSPIREANRTNFFLLVDQFEELFRFSMEKKNAARKDEAIDFVNILLELSTQDIIPLYIVFTMRSDFIGDCAQFHGLPEAMNKSQYLVPRLNRRQLKLVIEGPARLYGGNFSSVLTSKLLNKLGQVQDELPLLQHILMRIWDYEELTDKNGELDIEDYNNVGGLEKALSNHADEAADGMTQREKDISKEMFKALTSIDENGRKIRRPLLLSDLKKLTGATDKELEDVIDHFIRDKRSFLILEKAGDSRDMLIDISHESLIRQWDTLGGWVEEEAESASYYLQLSEATRLNKLKKKDYLTGSELQIALDWKKKFKPTAVWANRYKEGFDDCLTYLENSEIEFNRLKLKERQRKQIKKITLFTIAGLVGLVAAMFIYSGIEEVKRNKAYGLFIDGSEIQSTDPTIALDSMIKAIKVYPELPSKFWDMAQKTYNNYEHYETILEGTIDSKTPVVIDQSGTGNFYVSGNKKYFLQILNGLTGEYIDEINLPKEPRVSTTLPNNAGYIVGYGDGSMAHYDTNGKLRQTFDSEINSRVSRLTLSKNNENVLAIYDNGTLILWDIKGKILFQKESKARVVFARLSSDGRRLLSQLANRTIELINIESNKIITIESKNGYFASSIFSPNEKHILLGYSSGLIEAYDLKGIFDGNLSAQINYIKDGVQRITISPDRTKIFITTKTGWLLLNKKYEVILNSKDFGMFPNNTSLAGFFYSEADMLATLSRNYETNEYVTRLYNYKGEKIGDDISRKEEGLRFTTFSNSGSLCVESRVKEYGAIYNNKGTKLGTVNEMLGTKKSTFSSDGSKIINYNQKEVRVYNLKDSIQDKMEIANINKQKVITSAIHQNNQLILATSEYSVGGELFFMNKVNSELVINNKLQIKGHNNNITALSLSPDGEAILTGDAVGKLILTSTSTKEQKEFIGHKSLITGIEFSKKDKVFYTSSFDKSIKKWSSAYNKAPVLDITDNTSAISAIKLLPDEKSILSGSIDGKVILWDSNKKIIKELRGHRDKSITSISISENGEIVTASEDGAVKSWDNYNSYNSFRSYEDLSSINVINDSIIKVFSNSYKDFMGYNYRKEADRGAYIRYDSLYNMNIQYENKDETYISPEGSKYLTIKNDSSAVLKQIDGKLIKNFGKFNKGINVVAFSKNEKSIYMGLDDGTLIMVDENLKSSQKTFEEISDENQTNRGNDVKEINSITISNDESIALLSYKNDSIVYKWDLNEIDKKRFQGLSNEVTSHDISNDGLYIIAGSSNGEALIWKMDQHRKPISVLRLNENSIAITKVKFSPDGRHVFVGSANGKGLLWMIKNEGDILLEPEIVQIFDGNLYNNYNSEIIEAEFSLRGDLLITGSKSGIIFIYKIDPKEPFKMYMKNKEGIEMIHSKADKGKINTN